MNQFSDLPEGYWILLNYTLRHNSLVTRSWMTSMIIQTEVYFGCTYKID